MIALAFSMTWRDMNITDAADNRATAGVAADSTFQDAILPIALIIMEHLQIEAVDFYCPGFTLEFADTEPRNEADEATTAALLFNSNIITRNEARQRVGEKTYGPIGDVFADQARLRPEAD